MPLYYNVHDEFIKLVAERSHNQMVAIILNGKVIHKVYRGRVLAPSINIVSIREDDHASAS